ncbi:DNA-binding transcriptional regulator YiaG [Mesorhizobium soli]|nr:DNA-binding transcriptional regulator YiaG [Mesorhizobium soli]
MRSVAGRFGFSVTTLRHWQQRSRQPERANRVQRLVIDQKALQAAWSGHLP